MSENQHPSRGNAVEQPLLMALRLRWLLFAAIAFATVVAMRVPLETAGLSFPRFAAPATAVLFVLLVFLWRSLAINRLDLDELHPGGGMAGDAFDRRARDRIGLPPEQGTLLPRFGPGTVVSLARALLLGLFAGFLALPRPGPEANTAIAWWPALLFLLVALGDGLDGWLARRSRTPTELGARLDTELDGAAIFLAVAVGVRWQVLPVWYLLVGGLRYIYVLTLWLHRRAGKQVHALPSSNNRRLIAGLQLGFLCAVLWPIVPAPGARIAAWVFGLPMVLSFLRDGCVATGLLNPHAAGYERLRLRAAKSLGILLVPLRIATALAVLLYLAKSWPSPPRGWLEALAMWPVSEPPAVASALMVTSALASVLIATGVLGRSAALLLAFGLATEWGVLAHSNETVLAPSSLGSNPRPRRNDDHSRGRHWALLTHERRGALASCACGRTPSGNSSGNSSW